MVRVLILLLLLSPIAQAGDYYAGLRIGESVVRNLWPEGELVDFSDEWPPDEFIDLGKKTRAGGLIVGYQFMPAFAIEIAYDHLYRDTFKIPQPQEEDEEDEPPIRVTGDIIEASISAVFSYQIIPNWFVHVRPGYAITRSKLAVDNFNFGRLHRSSTSDIYFGMGATHSFENGAFLRSEVRTFRDNYNYSIMLGYQF